MAPVARVLAIGVSLSDSPLACVPTLGVGVGVDARACVARYPFPHGVRADVKPRCQLLRRKQLGDPLVALHRLADGITNDLSQVGSGRDNQIQGVAHLFGSRSRSGSIILSICSGVSPGGRVRGGGYRLPWPRTLTALPGVASGAFGALRLGAEALSQCSWQ